MNCFSLIAATAEAACDVLPRRFAVGSTGIMVARPSTGHRAPPLRRIAGPTRGDDIRRQIRSARRHRHDMIDPEQLRRPAVDTTARRDHGCHVFRRQRAPHAVRDGATVRMNGSIANPVACSIAPAVRPLVRPMIGALLLRIGERHHQQHTLPASPFPSYRFGRMILLCFCSRYQSIALRSAVIGSGPRAM